jgi:E3 ubiquitin-protein ligase DOA10
MVLHKYGDRLYSGLRDVVNQHLREVADQVTSVHDDLFLDAINNAWSEHKVSMLMIRDILMYMVRRAFGHIRMHFCMAFNFSHLQLNPLLSAMNAWPRRRHFTAFLLFFLFLSAFARHRPTRNCC